MSTRRPRIKPVATLKPRRATTTTKVSSLKSEEESNKKENILTKSSIDEIVSEVILPATQECISTEENIKNQEKFFKKRETVENVDIEKVRKKRSSDHIQEQLSSIPAQTIPQNIENVALSPLITNPDNEFSEEEKKFNLKCNDIPFKNKEIQDFSSPNSQFKPDDDNIMNYFKPPCIPPSVQAVQKSLFNQKFNDSRTQSTTSINEDVMPLSPAKIRQRIRPTPCFGIRRNSIQGQDPDEDTNRRQRQLSTSSTYNQYNTNQFGQKTILDIGRIRTESTCSNISDINLSTKESGQKPKQAYRSDSYKRILNARKELFHRFNGQTPDKTRLKMFDLIYYNPATNPMKKNPSKLSSEASISERRLSNASNISTTSNIPNELKTEKCPEVDNSLTNNTLSEMEATAPVPQLKLGPNGEIILDEKSLVIETTSSKYARETLANSEIIYDDEFSESSGFYKRSKRTRDWPPEETIKFYRCLHTIGTDFSLMLTLFPNRSRRDLKLKFKREEKFNMGLINKALLHPKQFNIDELKSEFETEERELERLKEEWKELKLSRAKEKKATVKKCARGYPSNAIENLSDIGSINGYEFAKPPKRRKLKNKDKTGDEINNPDLQRNAKGNNKRTGFIDTSQTIIAAPELQDLSDKSDIQNLQIFSISDRNGTETLYNQNDTSCLLPAYNEITSQPLQMCELSTKINKIDEYSSMHIIPEDHYQPISSAKNADDNQSEKINKEDLFNVDLIHDGSSDFIFNESINETDIMNMNAVLEETMSKYSCPQPKNGSVIVYSNSNDSVQNSNFIAKKYNETTPESEVNNKSSDKDSSYKFVQEENNDNQDKTITLIEHTENKPNEIDENRNSNKLKKEQNNEDTNINVNIVNTAPDDVNSDDDGDDLKSLRDSLVVVASQDPNDQSKVIHEVFLIIPETGELSEEPLDLPADVIDRIVKSLQEEKR